MVCDIKQKGEDLPLVAVLGAGRSGTNFLADIISADPAFLNTVENRYIWNYRQKTFAHDVRYANEATAPVAEFIRNFFSSKVVRSEQIPIDKTPSNIFRIPFLMAVFPKVKILHVMRDGRANIYSRLREWQGGNTVVAGQAGDGTVERRSDYRSALFKRRTERIRDMIGSGSLPPSRIPAFLYDNFPTYLEQTLLGRSPRYGERFPGMSQHLAAHGVVETAGAQWRDGVMQAISAGRPLGPERYLEIRYEDLVGQPDATWAQIAAFLDIPAYGPSHRYLVDALRPNAAPDWKAPEYAEFLNRLEPFIRPTSEYLGYDWDS